MIDVDALAQEIRRVDGDNSLGAGSLAEALIPFLRAALTGTVQPVPEGAVKALEWKRGDGKNESNAAWLSDSPVGRYWLIERQWWLETIHVGHAGAHCKNDEAAKAAAQADFETRVRSCIVPAPLSNPEAPAATVEVKQLDLANLLRHAFMFGFQTMGGTTEAAKDWWPAYDPEDCPAFERIRSALVATPPAPTLPPIKLEIPTAPKGWPDDFGKTRDPKDFRWLPIIIDGPCAVTSWYAVGCDGTRIIISAEDFEASVPMTPAPTGESQMTKDQIKHMVNRFLAWKLPENFNPDAGISFKATFNENTAFPMRHEPSGTNLFDAVQAEAMVRFMIEGISPAPTSAVDGEMVLVPKAALDWLNGEGPDPSGLWFGDFPDDYQPKGAFWWRKYFSDMIALAGEGSLPAGGEGRE